ncbi:MAG: ABC transporter permease [Vicinamibacterales bacterium]
MSLWRKLTYLLPWVRRAEDRDIEEELAALKEMAGAGELGNLALAAEDARATQSWLCAERLAQDVRYALRSMARQKAFTAVLVVSLALGIGANTAIFSFMDAILLRPLPVHDPDALVVMKWRAKSYTLASSGMSWSTGGSSFDEASGTLSSIFPYGALQMFDDADDVVSSAFGYFSATRLGITTAGETDAVKGQYVSGGYFAGIGVAPVAGRLIQSADDTAATAGVAALSERFSRRRFGEPETALGQTIRVNDKPFEVIGVAPSDFFGAEPGSIPDIYLPMRADTILEPRASAKYADQHFYWVEIMARLKPGISLEHARSALAPRFRQFVESTATTDAERRDLPVLEMQSGTRGLDTLRRRYARPIYVLGAMVGLILLVACANVANLLLSRATVRRREIAVRLGLGASRARVIRQLLTESVLLASLGGAAGVAVAWWGIGVMTALLSNGRDNFTLHAELNWAVLWLTLVLSVGTGLLFGLAPALQATRVDVAPVLKEARVSHAPHRRGLRLTHALVVTQVVFSLVLLVAAGLFGRTLSNLHAIELGFDRDNVLLFTIRPATIGYQGPALPALFENLRAELGRLPGVQNVSLSAGALPTGGGTMGPVAIAGAYAPPRPDGRPPAAVFGTVGPSFFSTMRIPVVGRDFTDRDGPNAPSVVVVNRRLAAAFNLEQPVGRTLTVGKQPYEIVGVVPDALTFSLKEERRPAVYFSYLQSARPAGQMTYEIRTAGAPLALAGSVRDVVRRVDARLAIHDLKTQAAHVDQAISSEVTLARLCLAFAVLALVIACVGLYGTVAFNVAHRTNEIGIRMTLGAQRPRIVWMILREVLVLTVLGLAIGSALALAGSRYVGSLLYGVEPTDPGALAIGIITLLACGLAAGLLPARRAATIDPMVAVRHE